VQRVVHTVAERGEQQDEHRVPPADEQHQPKPSAKA
jgi:hypothetical protein